MKTSTAVLVVAFLWAAIYLPGLGSTELQGEEPRRILPARTMLRTGDFLQPHIGGKPYYRKPPLINWAIAGSFTVTGSQSEWAARLPTVLAVLLLAIVALLVGRVWLGLEGALLAAVFLLTAVSLIEKGRLAEIEGLYVALSGIAFIWWMSFHGVGASAWVACVPPALPLALAVLAKGPLHLGVYYLAVVCVAVYGSRAEDGRRLSIGFKREAAGHLAGVLVLLAIALPWFLMTSPPPTQGSADTLAGQVAGRLSLDEFKIAEFPGIVGRTLFLFFPWVLFFPLLWGVGVEDMSPSRPRGEFALYRGVRLALAIAFVALVLLPGARPRYAMPLVPPALLLLAFRLTAFPGRLPTWLPRAWNAANRGLLAIAMAGAISVVVISLDPLPWKLFVSASLVLAAGFLFLRSLKSRPDSPAVLALWTGGAVSLFLMIYGGAAPSRLRANDKIRPPAEAILARASGDETIFALNVRYQPFIYYLGDRCIQVHRTREVPADAAYVLMPDAGYRKLIAGDTSRGKRVSALLSVTAKDGKAYRLVQWDKDR